MTELSNEEVRESIRKQFEPWVDVKGLSAHSRMSESWIYHHKNEIPHATAGAKLLFKLSEFDRYLLDKKEEAARPGSPTEKEKQNVKDRLSHLNG